MGGRTAESESSLKAWLEPEHAQTRRPGDSHRRARKKRRKGDAGEETGLSRRPRTSRHLVAPGFFEMKTSRIVLLLFAGLVALRAPALAQNHAVSQKTSPAGDL